MKIKEYIKPDMEVIELMLEGDILGDSINSGNGDTPNIGGTAGEDEDPS